MRVGEQGTAHDLAEKCWRRYKFDGNEEARNGLISPARRWSNTWPERMCGLPAHVEGTGSVMRAVQASMSAITRR